jgi:hypothetical protein
MPCCTDIRIEEMRLWEKNNALADTSLLLTHSINKGTTDMPGHEG